MEGLFTRTARPGLKINDERLKASIFALLHGPPGNHGINRTTWTMATSARFLPKQGRPACAAVSGRSPRLPDKMAQSAARAHLQRFQILRKSRPRPFDPVQPRPDEAFFSIDEFGPFAVKAKPGRVLAAPGEDPAGAAMAEVQGMPDNYGGAGTSGNQAATSTAPRRTPRR